MVLQEQYEEDHQMTLRELASTLSGFLETGYDPNMPVRKDEGNRWLTPIFDVWVTTDPQTGERVLAI